MLPEHLTVPTASLPLFYESYYPVVRSEASLASSCICLLYLIIKAGDWGSLDTIDPSGSLYRTAWRTELRVFDIEICFC